MFKGREPYADREHVCDFSCITIKSDVNITKTHLIKNIENFTTKNWKFSDKNSYIFHISAQGIDRGHL